MNRLRLAAIWILCIAAALYGLLRMAWLIVKNSRKAWVMAIAFDQLANAAANGNPDETISSRANRARANGRAWGCMLCKLLDDIDPNHCQDSAGV